MDLLWCAEREAETRAAWAAHASVSSKGLPSINPRTMRHFVHAFIQGARPRKRRAPTVAAMPGTPLSRLLSDRLARMEVEEPALKVAALAATLEAAVRGWILADDRKTLRKGPHKFASSRDLQGEGLGEALFQ